MTDAAYDPYESCCLCPRACKACRSGGQRGRCGATAQLVVARAALHFWEEPPISGQRGSGAVFFSYCPLRCVYCQNASIAAGDAGVTISEERLTDIFFELEAQGALNINLVTPTHFAPSIRRSLHQARVRGLTLPIIWNTSGYELPQAISDNAGAVDIYLSDFKYASPVLAKRYSDAPDYPQVARAALDCMVEMVGDPVFDEVDGLSRLRRGVVVRHLMLPGAFEDSRRIVEFLWRRYGKHILLSLMNQYTPVLAGAALSGDLCAREDLKRCPELARRVSQSSYESLLDFADELGVEGYFWQEGEAAQESFIPAFDGEGVLPKEAPKEVPKEVHSSR